MTSIVLGVIGTLVLGLAGIVASHGQRSLSIWLFYISLVIYLAIVFKAWDDRGSTGTEIRPRFSERPSEITIKLGTTHITLPAGTEPRSAFNIGGMYPFSARLSAQGEILVDADIFAGLARSPILLRGNEISGRPAAWDMNSDSSALEIVNDRGDPLFQLEYTGPTSAKLQGVFVSGGSIMISDDLGRQIIMPESALTEKPFRYAIQPLFRYPSARFRGKRAKRTNRSEPVVDNTKPTPGEIVGKFLETGFNGQPEQSKSLHGTAFRWQVEYDHPSDKDGAISFRWISPESRRANEDLPADPKESLSKWREKQQKGLMNYASIEAMPASAEVAKALQGLSNGWPCAIEGTIESIEMLSIHVVATKIMPADFGKPQFLP